MKEISGRDFAREITELFELARNHGDGTMPRNRDEWTPFVRKLVPHTRHHGMMEDFKLGLAYLLQRPEEEVGYFSASPASLEEHEMRAAVEHAFAILWPDDDWRTIPTEDIEFTT